MLRRATWSGRKPGMVWKETDGVRIDDEELEAKESFLSLERVG